MLQEGTALLTTLVYRYLLRASKNHLHASVFLFEIILKNRSFMLLNSSLNFCMGTVLFKCGLFFTTKHKKLKHIGKTNFIFPIFFLVENILRTKIALKCKLLLFYFLSLPGLGQCSSITSCNNIVFYTDSIVGLFPPL